MSSQVLTQRVAKSEANLVLGKPLKRKEDLRLLTGKSKFVDDIKMPNMLHASVLRSSYAHARIKNIDYTRALQSSGVRLVLSAKDLPEKSSKLSTIGNQDGSKIERFVLASEEVSYVGEPVVFIVADSKHVADDALELVEIEYEPLHAVSDPRTAIDENSPKAHLSLKTNAVLKEVVESGDVNAAFQKAAKVVKLDLLNQRLAPAPMEPRALMANFEEAIQTLNVWISTQGPFQNRSDLSEILGLDENKVRVFAPDVGGGFGAKLSTYPEDVLVCLAAIQLKHPVKWVENRSENFLSMTHGRGQLQHVELAATEKGRILGLKVKLIGDAGAYLTEGSSDATFTLKMAPGQYLIPAYHGEAVIALTNKVPHDAYRGASRPEATYLIERAMDQLARELSLEPAEVRLRNFIPKEDFPFKTVTDLEYDSGDYAMNLKKALELSDYEKWRDEQKRAARSERIIGIGLATYVEICAFGPEFPQTAAISITQDGKITVISGTSPHGQGHETPFAQIVADKLGVSVDDVTVVYGDTGMLPWGTFTAGSRSAALGGSAVLMCAEKIREKMAKIAAKSLGAPAEDIEFVNSELRSKSHPQDEKMRLSFKKVASYAYRPKKLPEGMEPVLYEFSAFAPPNYTYPFGTHIVVVEVDEDTGKVKLLDYTSVDDCGKVLNPLIVEGQVHGGAAQGLGQALLEVVAYDNNGQPLATSFLDYQIPTAEDMPPVHTYRTETTTYSNALGIKGIGEAATIASTPALMNAISDAFAQRRVRVENMPLKPEYVLSLMKT
ncbi:MAG: xanthine dehydrogenase family protein molybdopterin-binding subunit [Nitrososphaerota archaeon]|nr:xanthine dehydrogenase family protein molybdopterin-binding subunit [Nitrososphaerota archaeon]